MSTPRSPVRRTVDDTSFEEEPSKVPRMDTDRQLLAGMGKMLAAIEELKAGQRETNEKLDGLVTKVAALEERVADGEVRTGGVEDDMRRVMMENAQLRGMYEKLGGDLDNQIDRGLRDHLVFYGISGHEKTWELTALRLAGWLATNLPERTEEDYNKNIWRAHRGPVNAEKGGPGPIFAYMNYRYVDYIEGKMKFTNVGGASLKNQYSENTQARVNEALVYRKKWKAENNNAPAYISFPATLKVKKAGETRYKVEKIF